MASRPHRTRAPGVRRTAGSYFTNTHALLAPGRSSPPWPLLHERSAAPGYVRVHEASRQDDARRMRAHVAPGQPGSALQSVSERIPVELPRLPNRCGQCGRAGGRHKRGDHGHGDHCARWTKYSARLINGRFCISCYNRNREALVGKNAKGSRPALCDRLHPVSVAVVEFGRGACGSRRAHHRLGGDDHSHGTPGRGRHVLREAWERCLTADTSPLTMYAEDASPG